MSRSRSVTVSCWGKAGSTVSPSTVTPKGVPASSIRAYRFPIVPASSYCAGIPASSKLLEQFPSGGGMLLSQQRKHADRERGEIRREVARRFDPHVDEVHIGYAPDDFGRTPNVNSRTWGSSRRPSTEIERSLPDPWRVSGQVVISPVMYRAEFFEAAQALEMDLDVELDSIVERSLLIGFLEETNPLGGKAKHIPKEPEVVGHVEDVELGEPPKSGRPAKRAPAILRQLPDGARAVPGGAPLRLRRREPGSSPDRKKSAVPLA